VPQELLAHEFAVALLDIDPSEMIGDEVAAPLRTRPKNMHARRVKAIMEARRKHCSVHDCGAGFDPASAYSSACFNVCAPWTTFAERVSGSRSSGGFSTGNVAGVLIR
jgi:hypothetical protein